MKKYKTQLTKQQISILNDKVDQQEHRNKCFSVLSYIIKYTELNEGSWSKSIENISKMYNRCLFRKMSLSNMRKIINKLRDLGLIVIDRINNRNSYRVMEKVTEKKEPQSIENTNVKENSELHKDLNTRINTNTNIIERFRNCYKGIAGNKNTSKKDLIDIAKSLLAFKGVRDGRIEAEVFRKLLNCNTNIQLVGAVQYIDTVIIENLLKNV